MVSSHSTTTAVLVGTAPATIVMIDLEQRTEVGRVVVGQPLRGDPRPRGGARLVEQPLNLGTIFGNVDRERLVRSARLLERLKRCITTRQIVAYPQFPSSGLSPSSMLRTARLISRADALQTSWARSQSAIA